ncbi:MAG: hypothetical protein L6Q99_06510 [Planctomycetes bacterium]|nr:hypothetical protein [Planctomycetota bacterium]
MITTSERRETRRATIFVVAVLVFSATSAAQTPPSTNAPDTGSFTLVNGPYVTGIGDGFNGANTSSIESGFSMYGYDCSHEIPLDQRVADEFVVPPDKVWVLKKLHWLGYEIQPLGSTASSITQIHVVLWAGPPGAGGSLLWSANAYLSSSWTGVYRVQPPFLADFTRPIVDVVADLGGAPFVGAGSYWLDVSLLGSTTLSGPFAIPTVPHASKDDARQHLGLAWTPVVDPVALLPQDFPFTLEGVEYDCPQPASYCTAKVSSHGCVPAISLSAPPSVGSGSLCTLATVHTEGKRWGLFFHGTKGKQATPFHGGYFCLQPPTKRHAPQHSGGTAGACDGVFSEDFNAYIASGADPQLVAGAKVWIQTWSRDPGASFGDNLSDAVEAIVCP